MNKIAQYLNQHTAGNVFDKLSIREAYATDRSILRIVPRFVAVPEDTQDVRKLLRFSDKLAEKDYDLPVTIRGRGHDKTGAAVGGGIVISMEKMSRLQEVDVRGRLVRVQAGITLGELNTALALQGLTIPVKAEPGRTIGGLIANITSDAYAGKYGGIYNYVDRAEVVLSDGSVIQTQNLSKRAFNRKTGATDLEGKIYREIDHLIEDNSEQIAKITDQSFDAAGYSTLSLVRVKKTTDLLPLLFASQGTLGVITEVILRCELLPPEPQHMIATFNTIRTAIEFMKFVRQLDPLEVNIYDTRILQAAEAHGKKPTLLTHKLHAGFAVLVSFNDQPRISKRKLKRCLKQLPASTFAVIQDEDNAPDFQDLDNAVISYLNDDTHGERTPLVDDVELPDDQLSNFLTKLKELEQKVNSDLPLYGSFTASNYSVRPELQLESVSGRQFALKFLKDYARLVREHGGLITGGSPEGQVKAMVTDLPDEQKELYGKVKDLFDPRHILGPEVKLGANPRTTIRHMRASYNHHIITE